MNYSTRNSLIANAVPTKFNIPNPPKPLASTRKPPAKRPCEDMVEVKMKKARNEPDLCPPFNTLGEQQTKLGPPKVSYHLFPEKSDVGRKCVENIRKNKDKYFSPNKTKHVCSRHFLDSGFSECTKGLKFFAVPTVFPTAGPSQTFNNENGDEISELPGNSSPQKPDKESKKTPTKAVQTVLNKTENVTTEVEIFIENPPKLCNCSKEIMKLKEDLKQKDELIKAKDTYLKKLLDCATDYQNIKDLLEIERLKEDLKRKDKLIRKLQNPGAGKEVDCATNDNNLEGQLEQKELENAELQLKNSILSKLIVW